MRASLIFNPSAGNPADSAMQLFEVIRHLHREHIHPEVLLAEPEHRLDQMASQAVRSGANMVIASGGDGTIESVAIGLIGSRATLGIIPTGTRNNLALSLGIPIANIPEAVALLRQGRQVKIDVGEVNHDKRRHFFLEASVIGLPSALYQSADNIQRGDLAKIPEFISTFVSAAPSQIRLRIDRQRKEIITQAHLVIVANMPFIGPNYQIAPDIAFNDRRLDVFVYSDLSKAELLGQAVQLPIGTSEGRIQRFRTPRVQVITEPAMPIMADGFPFGDGAVTATLHSRQLKVMAGALNGKQLSMSSTPAAQESLMTKTSAPAEVPHGQ